MSNNAFITDCDVIRLYYENKEANIINDLYFETADDETFGDKVDELGKKVKAKIEKIIESIKEFFEQIKRKHESAKVQAMLRGECARSKKLIKATINDKPIIKKVSNIYKCEQKAFVDLRKTYDQFMSHKIDFDEYTRRTDKIYEDYADALDKSTRDIDDSRLINVSTPKGNYELSELTKHVAEVDKAYNKVLDKMREDVIKEEQKIATAAARTAVNNTTASATSKFSSMLSRVNKKAATAIIATVAIVSAATFCYKHGLTPKKGKGSDEDVNESAEEDYFSDILGDTFAESTEIEPARNIFEDILNS